jgi:sarcosine oxidase subunit alpha
MSTLKPGRARYGFMLSETGVVHDDGVVLRLAEDRFVVSASSEPCRLRAADPGRGAAGPVRPVAGLVHDVTAAWVTLTVTGPRRGL